MKDNKFNNHLALFLLKTLTPILLVIFVLCFITLATELLCPDEVLRILFNVDANKNYEPTKRYVAFYEFIHTGKNFIYYLIDQIVGFTKYMLHDLMPDHEFGNAAPLDKCPTPNFILELCKNEQSKQSMFTLSDICKVSKS